MPRANRTFCPDQVWHITHRCHQRAFLLKFLRDRRRWRHWLFEARRRYGLSVLNYIVTSNHIHLLCADRGTNEISRSLQLIEGRVAQEFNERKNRRGAFWEDRYQATAVQSDGHLARCITYIDLNMVRARVVRHPRDWEVCGFNEIQNAGKRKRVIDIATLMRLLKVDSRESLIALQNRLLNDEIENSQRNSIWTESIAVGDAEYLQEIKCNLGPRGKYRNIESADGFRVLREFSGLYCTISGNKLSD